MIIDDNDVDRMMARRMANRTGAVDRFLSFGSALDALDFLDSDEAYGIDLILLDRMMPRMDGLAFLKHAEKRAAERLQNTAIFMLTTVISEDEMNAASSSPYVKGFLNKPLSDRQMAEVLNSTG